MALTDLLFSMGVKPDGIVGHSLGEGSCAYADGCHTRRETMLSAYFRGQCVVDSNVGPGKMAAVGKYGRSGMVKRRYVKSPVEKRYLSHYRCVLLK